MLKSTIPYNILQKRGEILLGARGSSIDSFNLQTGQFLWTWRCPPSAGASIDLTTIKATEDTKISATEEVPASPAEKHKLSQTSDELRDAEANSQQKKKQRETHRVKAADNGCNTPTFVALSSTRDAQYVVGVTGEDKCIRVFKWNEAGTAKQCLEQLSQRTMPKRPCGIALTKDDSRILSADKFGDVWSLPLLCPEVIPGNSSETTDKKSEESPAVRKPFMPAASNLTVHSARNLKALEYQKRQTNQVSEKAELNFEKQLLLGHVSMLTDIALSTVNGKDYIITCDRDEHIRISRGIPQAHVIENFCLGHTEFVSRLCVPENRPGILISGGGDAFLYVWDWADNLSSTIQPTCKCKIEKPSQSMNDSEAMALVVSGICHMRPTSQNDIIIVICEGVNSLFVYSLTANNQLECPTKIITHGNPLAIVDTGDGSLLVSIDYIYGPDKTGDVDENRPVERQTSGPKIKNSLVTYKWSDGMLSHTPSPFLTSENARRIGAGDAEVPIESLSSLLYPLRSLRKRKDLES